MKYIVKIIVIFLSLFSFKSSYSDSGVAYINMEIIMNNSKAGKSITLALEEQQKKNIADFSKIENDLKDEEDSLIAQKNVLSREDYEKKVNILKNKVNEYRKNRRAKLELFNQKKTKATNELLIKIRPILKDYSVKNSLSIILEQKNIVLGKKDLDITNNILEIVDKTFTKIDLN